MNRKMSDKIIWSEKYRPQTLDDIQGQPALIRTLRNWIKQKDMPNALLYGAPGVGKTAAVRAFAMDLYGDTFNENFTELNASNDRGINVIRTDVKEFAEYAPEGNHDFKILYLGEIDGLTKDAQDALKRTIETSADVVRFMADCNNINALIPAIKSRFVRIYVPPVPREGINKRILWILEEEGLIDYENGVKGITSEAINHIIDISEGDLRNALQLLQALPYDGNPLTVDFVRELAPSPTKKTVVNLIKRCMTKSTYKQREGVMQEALAESGHDAYTILELMYNIIYEKDAKDLYIKSQLLETLGEYMYRTTKPCNPIIQLRCCLNQIQLVMGV